MAPAGASAPDGAWPAEDAALDMIDATLVRNMEKVLAALDARQVSGAKREEGEEEISRARLFYSPCRVPPCTDVKSAQKKESDSTGDEVVSRSPQTLRKSIRDDHRPLTTTTSATSNRPARRGRC